MTRSLESSRLREVLAVEGMKTRRWLGSGSSVAEMKMLDENGVDGDWLGSFAACEGRSSQGRSVSEQCCSDE